MDMVSSARDASLITVQQTLDLLDGPFASVAKGVADDRYAFWLGSGISFGRVEGLRQIVPRVIEYLRVRIDHSASTCRFRTALKEVFDLASLTSDERGRTDLERPYAEWPDADAITERLVTNYARLLDVTVEGEPDDYLIWAAVDVPKTFASPTLLPDVEHLCLAILVLEGVASTLATANWDALVERALSAIGPALCPLSVYVRPEDIRAPEQRARLYKFHGCAVCAVQEEASYRPYIIARQSQINAWATSEDHKPIVAQLVSIAISKPTMMIGLSAQDANIQSLFAAAESEMPWPWPGDRPSVVFSGHRLGPDHKGLLKNVYKGTLTPERRSEIETASLITAYGKPLLIALVLHVLVAKLQQLARLALGAFSNDEQQLLLGGHIALRNLVAAGADGDRFAFVTSLVTHSGRALSLLRDGSFSAPERYNPLTNGPLHISQHDLALPASGLREGAVAVALLGLGITRGLWTLCLPNSLEGDNAVARLVTAAGSTALVVVANDYVALRAREHGLLEDGADAVVIHSGPISMPLPRSPRSAPGRTGKVGRRQVSIDSLLREATTCDDLLQRFREEIAA